jgi:hypothetical protein
VVLVAVVDEQLVLVLALLEVVAVVVLLQL